MQAMSMTKGWLLIAAVAAVPLAACSKSSDGSGDAGDADADTDTDTNLECAWEVIVPLPVMFDEIGA